MANQQVGSLPEKLNPISQQKNIDAHQAAPPELKSFFKRHSNSFSGEFDEIVDFKKLEPLPGFESITKERVAKAFAFLRSTDGHSSTAWHESLDSMDDEEDPMAKDFSAVTIPGLSVYPGLLPCDIQLQLLNRLLNRDLLNPAHQTNLHAHYNMVYPEEGQSWFSDVDATRELQPKDATAHKPLSIEQALRRKLRWMTLGGQYDWTNKLYSAEAPPEFPEDIKSLIQTLFHDMEPQAAIVNVYSPGDKLNMHRDVSEEVDEGLVSISLGCSCVFIIGLEDEVTHEVKKLAIRLHSGDVVYMKGKSRLAWHGVPRIEKDSCPLFLQRWPGEDSSKYYDWMSSKRINLNVRQMREATVKESQNTTENFTIDAPDLGFKWERDRNVLMIDGSYRLPFRVNSPPCMFEYIAAQDSNYTVPESDNLESETSELGDKDFLYEDEDMIDGENEVGESWKEGEDEELQLETDLDQLWKLCALENMITTAANSDSDRWKDLLEFLVNQGITMAEGRFSNIAEIVAALRYDGNLMEGLERGDVPGTKKRYPNEKCIPLTSDDEDEAD